jgi:hypothetical protein
MNHDHEVDDLDVDMPEDMEIDMQEDMRPG